MISTKKRLDFYQTIFNDEKICPMFLAGLISERELEFEENREMLSSITNLVMENFDQFSFPNEKIKESVKKFFEKTPKILKQYKNENASSD